MEAELQDQTSDLAGQIWTLFEPIITREGMHVIEVEYRKESPGWVLRFYIDREGGVSVDDCARISRMVSDILDAGDLIPTSYTLEVSSPGLNRPLRKWEHFRDQLGKVIEVRTVAPIGDRRNFKGILKQAAPELITVDCGDDQIYDIALGEIERARLRYFESLGQ